MIQNGTQIGFVGRALRKILPSLDGPSEPQARFSRYGEQYALIPMFGERTLCNQGSLMIASMKPSQTVFCTGQISTTARTAIILITNTAAIGSPIRLHMREIHILPAAGVANGDQLSYNTLIDNVYRGPTPAPTPPYVGDSPPTTATGNTAWQIPTVCTNMDEPQSPVGKCWISYAEPKDAVTPAMALASRGPNNITTGNGNLRSRNPIGDDTSGIQDDYRIVFGSGIKVLGATLRSSLGVSQVIERHVPIVLGPQKSFQFNILLSEITISEQNIAGLDISWFEV